MNTNLQKFAEKEIVKRYASKEAKDLLPFVMRMLE